MKINIFLNINAIIPLFKCIINVVYSVRLFVCLWMRLGTVGCDFQNNVEFAVDLIFHWNFLLPKNIPYSHSENM